MRKTILAVILSSLLSQGSHSAENTNQEGGMFRIESEFKTTCVFISKRSGSLDNVGNNYKLVESGAGNNINSSTSKLKVYADYLNENNFGYGAFVKLNSTPLKNSQIIDDFKIYLQNDFGKLEFGTTSSVVAKLSVNAYDLARANGGLDGDGASYIKKGFIYDKLVVSNVFITSPKLTTSRDNNNKANKLNFFLPKMKGFTFGVTFIPNTDSKMLISVANNALKPSNGHSFKNVIQPGMKYEGKISKNISFTSGLVSEFGKARDYKYNDYTTHYVVPRNNLFSWQVGGNLGVKNLSFAASYGNQGKSGTAKKTEYSNKCMGTYWSIASSYAKYRYGVNINYMQSKRAGYIFGSTQKIVNEAKNNKVANKFSALVIGGDYKVTDNLVSLIEYSRFKFYKNNNFHNRGQFNNGHIILLGSKLQI